MSILKFVIILAVAAAFCCYVVFQNTRIKAVGSSVESNRIPPAFDNFKIVQIADFHNCGIKRIRDDLADEIKKQNPDIIVITGDFIDSRHTRVYSAVSFLKKFINTAPVYFANGNHECTVPDAYQKLKAKMEALGVIFLENESVTFQKKGEVINIAGINDPLSVRETREKDYEITVDEIRSLGYDNNYYTILLAHRPEIINAYAEAKVDLVLSGHAHGGQIRLPFGIGLFAPQQGFFPKYTGGKYISGNTAMNVSKGCGKVFIPPRINNRPELTVITLRAELPE